MPPRTLNQMIGCWTSSDDGLRRLDKLISQSVRDCAKHTYAGNPIMLKRELEILQGRVGTMQEMTKDALRRLREIEEKGM